MSTMFPSYLLFQSMKCNRDLSFISNSDCDTFHIEKGRFLRSHFEKSCGSKANVIDSICGDSLIQVEGSSQKTFYFEILKYFKTQDVLLIQTPSLVVWSTGSSCGRYEGHMTEVTRHPNL